MSRVFLLILAACTAFATVGCDDDDKGSDGTGFQIFQYVNGEAVITGVEGYTPDANVTTYACVNAEDNASFDITVTAVPRGIDNDFARNVTLEVETAEVYLEPLQGGGAPLLAYVGNSMVPLAIVPYNQSRAFSLIFEPSVLSLFQEMGEDDAFEYRVRIRLKAVERLNTLASSNISGDIDLYWDRFTIAGSAHTCPGSM